MGDNSNRVRTMVLVGCTGNGKSATGNSILGRRAFNSRLSSSGVTETCEKRILLKNGQIVNVIDTPGFFDFSADSEFVDKEIIKCIDLAKDGIHAILLVFSVVTRFSREENAAIHSLLGLFGSKIIDYTIVVFTGGDLLEGFTLEEYLGHACPKPLKEILLQCENRCVLFDNKTTNATKKDEQVRKLLSLVNSVIVKNNGQPYTNEIFAKLKIESKHRETITMLEKQLAEVQAVRLKELKIAQSAQIQSDAEIGRLKEDTERVEKENDELRNSVSRGATKIRDQQVEIDSLKEYSKQEILKVEEQMRRSYEEQLKQITEMESKLRETITRLEQLLAEEQAAQLKELEIAQSTKIKSDAEICRLREDIERAEKENKELCNNIGRRRRCDIL